jgi:tetratricopeptide (TPR) repeat protein
LRRAGEQVAAQFASAEAAAYFTRALELTPEEDLAGRYDLLMAGERVYDVQGAREAQGQDVTDLYQLAEGLGDDARRVEVTLRQGRWAQLVADYPARDAAYQRAVRLAHAVHDASTQVIVHQRRALQVLREQGDFQAARSRLEQALTLARAAGLRREEADCLRHLGTRLIDYQGNFAGGRACYEQALGIYC